MTRTISESGTGVSTFASYDPGDATISSQYTIDSSADATGTGTYDIRVFGTQDFSINYLDDFSHRIKW